MNQPLTHEKLHSQHLKDLPTSLGDHNDVLTWAFSTYSKITYACSFGVEGMVLIDLISQIKAEAEIVFLDTGLHFQETYELIEKVRERYPQLKLEMVNPRLNVEEQAEEYGEALWERDPNHCCLMRKIEPLKRALQGKQAWISGLRREQSPTRRQTPFVDYDEKFHLIKICPLIHWSWNDIWDYVKAHDLPYNELHDQGFPSIGCFPCTQPAKDSGDLRSGRWDGFTKTECGLHQ